MSGGEGRRGRRGKEPEDRRGQGVRGYAHAVMVLDASASPAELAGEVLRNGVTPLDALTGLIYAVRDVLRLRGWLRDEPIVIDQAGHLQTWSPRLNEEPPRLRLVVDLETVNVAQLGALWIAHKDRLQVTLRLISRQLPLGEAPPAQDLEALMQGHDAGQHEDQPDWACPACLLRAAEERLTEQAAEGPQAPEDEAGAEPEPLAQ